MNKFSGFDRTYQVPIKMVKDQAEFDTVIEELYSISVCTAIKVNPISPGVHHLAGLKTISNRVVELWRVIVCVTDVLFGDKSAVAKIPKLAESEKEN